MLKIKIVLPCWKTFPATYGQRKREKMPLVSFVPFLKRHGARGQLAFRKGGEEILVKIYFSFNQPKLHAVT